MNPAQVRYMNGMKGSGCDRANCTCAIVGFGIELHTFWNTFVSRSYCSVSDGWMSHENFHFPSNDLYIM